MAEPSETSPEEARITAVVLKDIQRMGPIFHAIRRVVTAYLGHHAGHDVVIPVSLLVQAMQDRRRKPGEVV